VPAGEIVVSAGAFGAAGKTTTLRCVAGLEHPTSVRSALRAGWCRRPARGILVPAALTRLAWCFSPTRVAAHDGAAETWNLSPKHRKIAPAPKPGAKVDEVAGTGRPVGICRPAGGGVVGRSECSAWPLARSIVYRPNFVARRTPVQSRCQIAVCGSARLSGIILKQTGMTALYGHHDQAEAVVLGDRIGRDARWQAVARWAARTRSTTGRPICSSPISPAHQLRYPAHDRAPTEPPGWSRSAAANASRWRCCTAIATGEKIRIALRPEIFALASATAATPFNARVLDRRYQGTRPVYDIDLFGHRLEVLELGTAPRIRSGSKPPVSLPRGRLLGLSERDLVLRLAANHGSDNFEL